MYVIAVGLNHRTAPIEIREKITFADDILDRALEHLKGTKSVLEGVILSTCNRTEVYGVVDQLHTGEHFIKKFIAEWFSISRDDVTPFLYVKTDIDATEHLFRVIAGLDSMVIGETQILGQIKNAFLQAQKSKATGTIFNTLFKQAITFAKKVHAETGIGENAVSISYAAVELAKRKFERLDNKKVLLIGAGETSELTAIHLHGQGVKNIIVVNRTYEAALKLAETFHGKAYPMADLSLALIEADIVVSSTSAEQVLIDRAFIEPIMKDREDRPLFMIDLAVPRDIDPSIKEIETVYLYDIDNLQDIVNQNLEERKKTGIVINRWIDDEVYDFYQWMNTLGVIPLITALREKSFRIQEETMKSIHNKLPQLTERELSILRKHTKSIVNQMLKDPILRVKEMAAEPNAEYMLDFFKHIFAIEDEEIESNPIYENMKKRESERVVSKNRLTKMSSRM